MSTSVHTGKSDVTAPTVENVMSPRDLFYPKDPVVGKLLTLKPFALFIRLMLAAAVLILLAKVAGIFSIPLASGNVGFWYSYNWSLMYLFVVPLIFAIASYITSSLPQRIKDVTKPATGTGCIVPSNQQSQSDYFADFQKDFERFSTRIMIGALIVAVVIEGWDSWALWTALIHKSALFPDWSTAYALPPENGWHPPSRGMNAAFDVVAYLFQVAYIFLAFYWVGKCCFFFITFSRLMLGKNPPYKFVPKDAHPSLRMGLRRLSPFFNSFLVMTTLFLAFVLYHRFQLMQRGCRMSFPTFVSQVMSGMKDPAIILNFGHPIYGMACLDIGMTLLLICLVLPIVVIAYFPLGVLRHHATEQRDMKLQELGAKLEEALAGDPTDEKNAKLVKNLDDRIERLQNACVWPNGDRAALYFLGTIVVLAVGAWLPPLLVVLGVTGLGSVVLREVREIAKLKHG